MRRSKWKNLYVETIKQQYSLLKKTEEIPVISRSSSIVPRFVGLTFSVHTGKNFKQVVVVEDMVGHKFGEFVKTRADFVFKKKKKKKT